MHQVSMATVRRPTEGWHLRSSTWLAVAAVSVGAAFLASRVGSASGVALGIGLAAVCALTAAVLTILRVRAARAEMVAMIDAHLAARDLHPLDDTEEEARQRISLSAARERIVRGASLRTWPQARSHE